MREMIYHAIGLLILLRNANSSAIYAKLLGGKVPISNIGIGTWAWGDKLYWNYESSQDASLKEVFDFCVKEGGVNFFDTAEIYGFGRSELLCGRFRRQLPEGSLVQNQVVLATKFAPLPFRLGSDCVVSACQDSLDRMGVDKMGLYQLHWPGLFNNDAYLEGLVKCYEKGLVEAVGVSNYGPEQLRRAHKYLSERGVPLASNQIQYSLLCRQAESNELLRTAEDLGVTILAYSPLAQGLLTGKFDSAGKLPTGPRSALARATLPKIKENLLLVIKNIAVEKSNALNLNVTMSQVALNWFVNNNTKSETPDNTFTLLL
jgi:pyridoxine 4-dehydrogenase